MDQQKISTKDLKKLKPYLFEIPKSFRKDMQVPARVYTSAKMLENILQDESLIQLVNATTLPGIVKYAVAMPDIHSGYGLPIGGVMATKLPDGIISPGSVGYDINCGVRLLKSEITEKELKPYLANLGQALFSRVPSGLGKGGKIKLTEPELDQVLKKGAQWAAKNGYIPKEDLEFLEEKGRSKEADVSKVSQRAKVRGSGQLGTLGSGNHFLEIEKVEKIFEPEVAETLGLFENQITILIHTGSRGLGHQIATDYIRICLAASQKYNIKLVDRELAAVPLNSPEGQDYFAAMSCGLNYAWANRSLIASLVREVWSEQLTGKIKKTDLKVLNDVAHNIAKIEEYKIDGKKTKVLVHRKGATRSFGPGRPEIPQEYQKVGQPVIIPGSMGTSSYVLVGTRKAEEEAFGSTAHGAGRTMSRKAAKRKVWGEDLKKQLKKAGILIFSDSMAGLAEEAPIAYKSVDEVADITEKAGIAKRVAQLKPLAVIKGS